MASSASGFGVGPGPMVAVAAAADVGSAPRGGAPISEIRGLDGEASAFNRQRACDLDSSGIPISAMSRGDRRPADGVPDGGCRGAHFGESGVTAGGCRFLWQSPGTIWFCECLRESLRSARIFGAVPARRYGRTEYRCRRSQNCIPYCTFRDAVGLLSRSWTAA